MSKRCQNDYLGLEEIANISGYRENQPFFYILAAQIYSQEYNQLTINMPGKISDINFNLSVTDDYGDDNEAFKFDLFLMTREIKQITDSLRLVTLMPKNKQKTWVKDNQQLLHKFMDTLTHDMFNVLDEMSLDQDVIQETIFCVTELRELVNTLNGLMTGGPRLQS